MDDRILEEKIIINEVEFIKRSIKPEYKELYSLRKVGTNEIYDEAIDLVDSNYEYELIEN